MRVMVFTTEVYRSAPSRPVHDADQADWPDDEYDANDLGPDSWSYPDRMMVRTGVLADSSEADLNAAITAHKSVCSQVMAALAVDSAAWAHNEPGAIYTTILPR